MSTEGLGRGPLKSSKGGCRKAPIPPSKLGKGHQGQVGPRYGKGLPNRIHKRPLPEDETAPTTIRGGAHGANEGGAERATAKRGGRADGTGQGRFLLNPVPSAEKRRQTTPRNKPQSAKPVRSDVPLQDGRLADAKGPVKALRLAGKGGPKGCLFRDPYKSKPQEVSTVCSGQPDLPVQLSPLWPGSSTMGLHQDPQASSGYAAPDGGSSGLLHRRHTPAGGDPDSGRGAGKGAAIPVGMSWLYCAPRQINHDPGASDGVPGNNSRLHKDGTEVACQKIKRHPGGGPKTGPAEGNSCESSVPISWEDECSQPYHTTCPAILQEPTDGHDRGPKCQQSELRKRSDAVSGLPGRAKVVGLSPEPVEREEHAAEGSGLSDRIRCVTDRVGSSLQPPTDWRAMVKGGAEPAHKLPELLAATLALKSFTKGQTGLSVLLKMDNTTAVAYVNNQGGTVSRELVRLSKELWTWCLQRNITIKAQHLPGRLNQVADSESRTMLDRSDWKLDSRVFQQIHQLWGPMEVDLFASRLTTQCPVFFSWRPDPYAAATDAFLQVWTGLKAYANPPWNLVGRVAAQAQAQQASLVLVAPVWRTQPWYPILLEMLVDAPHLIPPQRQATSRSQMRTPQLAAWPISGKNAEITSFRRKLARSSLARGGKKQVNPTTPSLGDGIAGVVDGVPIHFQAL